MNPNHPIRCIALTIAAAVFTSGAAASASEPDRTAEAAEHQLDAERDVVVEVEEEEPEDLNVAFLIDPVSHALGPALGMAVVRPEIQIALGDYAALDIMPAFVHYFGGESDITASGGGGNLGLRISPYGTGLRGFYVVPRVGAAYATGSSPTEELDTTVVNTTLELGYSWVFGNFVMNAGGGAGYAFAVDGYDIYQDSPVGGLQILANFSVGFGL